MSHTWEEWLDRDRTGKEPATVESFARSAIGELPRVTAVARLPNPALFRDLQQEPKP